MYLEHCLALSAVVSQLVNALAIICLCCACN